MKPTGGGMRRLATTLLALLCLAAAPVVSWAQAPAAKGDDPNAVLVEELVVNARQAGPAWWRVSKGDAVVFVLGVPGVAPEHASFDESLLRKRLDGADRLILAPKPDLNLFTLVRFLTQIKRLQAPQPLRSVLPAATAARLEAVQRGRGKPVADLDEMHPALAGFLLANAGDGGGVSLGSVGSHIAALARSKEITRKPRIVSTGHYDVLGQILALTALPRDRQIDCFEDGLRAAEAGDGVSRVFDRWAHGQVREVMAADRGFEACLSRSPDGSKDLRRRMAASVDAIRDALRRPGTGSGLSVAVVELRPLLAQGGVLDQLRAEGFEVRPPGG
jgi:uncharacterized protein YbaP (TraB family)